MGKFIAFSNGTSPTRHVSEDGIAWTSDTPTNLTSPAMMVADKDIGILVCAQGNGDLKYSLDEGVTWNSTGFNVGTVAFSAISTGIARMWRKNGKFYVCSGGGAGRYRLAISADGITWAFSPSRAPYDLYAPGPGNQIFAANPASNQYVISTDDMATVGSAQTAPVALIRDIVHAESINRTLFLGGPSDNPNWAVTNPPASGQIARADAYITDAIWSETFGKFIFAERNKFALWSGNPGGPFTSVATSGYDISMAEGNGFIVMGLATTGFLKVTDPNNSPTTVSDSIVPQALAYIEEANEMAAELVAPLGDLSVVIAEVPKISVELVAPFGELSALLSSSILTEVDLVAPLGELSVLIDRNEYEYLTVDFVGLIGDLSTTLATPADMEVVLYGLIGELNASIVVPPVNVTSNLEAIMGEFSAIISQPGLAVELVAPMGELSVGIISSNAADITLGFRKFQLSFGAEDEYYSTLTFVAVD